MNNIWIRKKIIQCSKSFSWGIDDEVLTALRWAGFAIQRGELIVARAFLAIGEARAALLADTHPAGAILRVADAILKKIRVIDVNDESENDFVVASTSATTKDCRYICAAAVQLLS